MSSNQSVHASQDVAGPPSEGAIWEEIGKLKSQIEEDRKGVLGWIRKWGVIVAFVGSAFAVPRALYDIRNIYKDSHPDIRFSKQDADLKIRNLPTSSSIEYEFMVAIANNGTHQYRIEKPYAKLEAVAQPNLNQYHTRNTEMRCKDSKTLDPILWPFSVNNNQTVPMTCIALFNPDTSKQALLQAESMQRLIVFVRDENHKEYSISYCFRPNKDLELGLQEMSVVFHQCDDN